MPIRCSAYMSLVFASMLGIVLPIQAKAQNNALPKFQDFPVIETFHGKPAIVNLKSDPNARMFRTNLRLGAAKGPNFAGVYTVVTWGCGTNCQTGAIVDERTGNVQFIPVVASVDIDYHLDSRLLTIDSPENVGQAYPDGWPEYLSKETIRYFEMKEGKLVPVRIYE